MTMEDVQFIDVNGASLAYRIAGPDNTGPLIITLHGGRGFGMNIYKYNNIPALALTTSAKRRPLFGLHSLLSPGSGRAVSSFIL